MTKYEQPFNKGICDYCGSGIEFIENHYFVRLEQENNTRIVHRECYARNQSEYSLGEYLDLKEEDNWIE